MKKLLLLISFLANLFTAYCQYPEIHFEQITDQQGLNDHSIKCILQDKKGFIWIGCGSGLYRYDGYHFTYFRDPPRCKNCPPHSYLVYSIVEDNLGNIWTITENGITVIDPETERSLMIYQFENDSNNSTRIKQDNLDMIKDSHGNIYAINISGYIKFSYNKNEKNKENIFRNGPESVYNISFIHPSPDLESDKDIVEKFYEDSDGNLWIGSHNGLYVLRKGETSFYRFEIEAEMKSNSRSWIADFVQQNEDTFLIISESYNYLMTNVRKALQGAKPDGSNLIFTKLSLPDKYSLYTFHRDNKKNVFIGTSQDVYKVKKTPENEDLSFEPLYKNRLDQKEYNQNQTINFIFEDRSGMTWIGHSGTIRRFNPEKSQFTFYNEPSGCTRIYIDAKGNKWIEVFGKGFYRINKDNKITRYNMDMAWNYFLSMVEISPGHFWVGCAYGVYELNSFTGKFNDPIPAGKTVKNLRGKQVWNILKDSTQLYLETSHGLFVYDMKVKRLIQFSFDPNDTSSTTTDWLKSPIKMHNGEIWAVSGTHGIVKINYNKEKGTLSYNTIVPYSVFRKSNLDLRGRLLIYQDSKGLLWLVKNTGLHLIDPERGMITSYKLIDNIEFPEAWSILEDNHSNLWIGTQFGLCRFDRKTGEIKHFTRDDGLPLTIHGTYTEFKDKDGQLYFGGPGGFYSFNPDSIKTNNFPPPIVITDFRLFNLSMQADTTKKSILSKNITYTTRIELRHDQNDLSLEFAALDYELPERNKYAYKLEGYKDEWIKTDANNRIANYTNLDPGTYIFRVKGSNDDGIWNEEGTSLTIIIKKPWWGTNLAWFFYILAFVGATGGFIRWRLLRLNRDKTKLERLVQTRTRQIEEQKEEITTQKELLEEQNQRITEQEQLKTRFFTNVSHEFRTPLSLIQNPVEELLDDPHRNEKDRRKLNMVHRNSRRLLNLVNQLLDIAKIDGSMMKMELIEADVMKHLKALAGSFTSMAETKSIRYELHFPEERFTSWFDADKLEKIALNLLSNAFKFTPEGGDIIFTAWYKITYNPEISRLLEFSVKDSGTGIPAGSLEKIFDRFYQVESSVKKEGGGTGIGLSLARDMARLMHGDITVESELCNGSIFSVQIPLGKDHLGKPEYIILKTIPATVPLFSDLQDDMAGTLTSEHGEKSNDEKPILLIVEDNRDIRMLLSDSFSREYSIVEAIDGVYGLKKATEIIPDLIITDIMMPRMDGSELCHKLKNDLRTSHIPVIMLTAKVTPEDKINGFHTGADDYIPKPFNMAELKARMANLIEQRRKLRERFSREVTLQPRDISITPLDEQFLNRAIEVVEKQMNNENFGLPEFLNEMNMTRSTLFRKLRALTSQSPTEFMRTIRLKRAASLLKQNFGNVTQVSLEVGFNSLSYFNTSFKKLYGISPLEYIKKE